MINNLTIFDYFKDNVSKNKFFFEIETNLKKSLKDIYDTVISLSKNRKFHENGKAIIILPNSIKFIEYILLCLLKKCTYIPIPYFLSAQEISKILDYINPNLVITDRLDIIKILKEKNFEVSQEDKNIYFTNTEILNEKLKEVAAIYYSSGTTSNPKGVMYSYHNMNSLISSINKSFHFNSNDKHLTMLPFGHTASINYNILPALMGGFELYIAKGFENLRTNFFNIIDEFNISYSQIVPTILFVLNKINLKTDNLKFKHLKFIGCGSSSLPLTSQLEFIEKYSIKVSNLYGLSETGPSHIDDPRENNWEPGSIGIPLDVNDCKLNQNKEILLKGDNVFVNYYKNNSLFRQVVKDDWFNTGDIGKYENNRYWYLDRSKDLIIKGGINIVPMEIEEIIYQNNEVLECCVVGKKDSISGEDVVAVVCLNSNDNQEKIIIKIVNHCKKFLSSYKVPSEIYVWQSLPKTPSKKILRREIRNSINLSE